MSECTCLYYQDLVRNGIGGGHSPACSVFRAQGSAPAPTLRLPSVTSSALNFAPGCSTNSERTTSNMLECTCRYYEDLVKNGIGGGHTPACSAFRAQGAAPAPTCSALRVPCVGHLLAPTPLAPSAASAPLPAQAVAGDQREVSPPRPKKWIKEVLENTLWAKRLARAITDLVKAVVKKVLQEVVDEPRLAPVPTSCIRPASSPPLQARPSWSAGSWISWNKARRTR